MSAFAGVNMPSDGGEYESEYDDEEESTAVAIEVRVGDNTEVEAAVEAEAQANDVDNGNTESVAAIDGDNHLVRAISLTCDCALLLGSIH